MKSKILKGILLGGIMTLLFACNSKKEEKAEVVQVAIDKEQIMKEIQTKENEFANAYNEGVTKPIGYYAEDAISFYQNRPPLIGRQAIVEFLISSSTSNSNKISFQTNEVFVSNDGDQVVEVGFFKLVDSANTIINSGNYMSLFVKREGKYVSMRDMSASDIPLQ